jgi:hypothetical protein
MYRWRLSVTTPEEAAKITEAATRKKIAEEQAELEAAIPGVVALKMY